MRKLIAITSFLFVFLLSACDNDDYSLYSEADLWESGCPYNWAVDDDGCLYATNSSFNLGDFNRRVQNKVWRKVEMRRIAADLASNSERLLIKDMDGGTLSYTYFTDTERITVSNIKRYLSKEQQEKVGTEWVYGKEPLNIVDNNRIQVADGYILGMIDGKYLETTGYQKYNPYEISYYTYDVYEPCYNVDIQKIMAEAISWEKYDSLIGQ